MISCGFDTELDLFLKLISLSFIYFIYFQTTLKKNFNYQFLQSDLRVMWKGVKSFFRTESQKFLLLKAEESTI